MKSTRDSCLDCNTAIHFVLREKFKEKRPKTSGPGNKPREVSERAKRSSLGLPMSGGIPKNNGHQFESLKNI